LNRLESWTEDAASFYQVEGEVVKDLDIPNQLIYSPGEGTRHFEAWCANNNETIYRLII